MKKLNESVLDPIQKNRCEALFDPNDHTGYPILKQDTKDFIVGVLNKFRDETGLQFNYDQAFIVGSSLGYQYRDDSDVDVNVRVDLGKSFFKGKYHFIPKNIMLPGTAHPINVFLLTKDDPEYNFERDAENAYDLLTDTWIKQGRLSNAAAIPYEYIAGVSEFIMDGMALELHRTERDMYDLEKYLRLDPTKVAITLKDINDAISKKIGDLIIDKDALTLAHTLMFRMERDGFNDQPINVSIKYTHDSRHYSMNNLIYKYVDSFHYYDKINEKLNEINKLIQKAKKHLEKIQLDADTPEVRNNIETQEEAEIAAQPTESVENNTPEQQPVEDNTDASPEEIQQVESSEQVENNNQPEEVVEESWTDNELKNILIQNGYESDNDTIQLLKENLNNKLVLIDSFDYDDEELMNIEESLVDKTERQINKIIYKKSGKVNELMANGLGFLINGPIGMFLFDDLAKERNLNKDSAYFALHSAIENDEACNNILSDIKNELKSENPDKKKLKQLKKDFAKAVDSCRKNLRKEEKESNDLPKISLKESFSNKELLEILKNNGYAPTEKNLKILQKNKNYILEEGANYEN